MERGELIARLKNFAGAALVQRGAACFLVDPRWGERERAQWEALAAQSPENWDGTSGWLCIPTGGSSGAMKLARHDEHTIGAAVEGFCAHFDVRRIDAVGTLPAWHVSGLMAWARCVWTGGLYRTVAWKDVESGVARPAGEGAFLSLVPTQLARLVGDAGAEAWLRGFRTVFLGGGPAWPDLLRRARDARLPVALSYGMTETAAMAAAQRPGEFAAGDETSGRAMPHVRITLEPEGRVMIGGESLFVGYWPETRAVAQKNWRTDDLGEWGTNGGLHVVGRADAMIITGGEKVNPAEVEAVLREAGGDALADVVVVGLPHTQWGSEVVAFYPLVEPGAPVDEKALHSQLERCLTAAKFPKRYIAIPAGEWPRDERGKVNRRRLARWA